jgi:hypothetical protein
MLQGLPAHQLIGFVWDVNDPLLPEPIRNLPTIQQAIRSVPPNKSIIQSGVSPQQEFIPLISPLAYQLAKMTPPAIIVSDPPLPPLIKALKEPHTDGWLLVVVLAARTLSLVALPVSTLITTPVALSASPQGVKLTGIDPRTQLEPAKPHKS